MCKVYLQVFFMYFSLFFKSYYKIRIWAILTRETESNMRRHQNFWRNLGNLCGFGYSISIQLTKIPRVCTWATEILTN